jgi:hypothetical protein
VADVTVSITGTALTAAQGRVNENQGNVLGRGFTWLPVLEMSANYGATLTGQGFAVTPSLFGGAVGTGATFKVSPTLSMASENSMYLTGQGFNVTFTGRMVNSADAELVGRGFAVTPQLFGGAVLTGRGFAVALSATSTAATSMRLTGRGFAVDLSAFATAPTTMRLTGRGFTAGLYYSRLTGRGFAVTPHLNLTYTVEYAEAYVMNTLNTSVTRYQNYPFMHIAAIGNTYYGVRNDGLYLLTGIDDTMDNVTLTPVNGTIITKDTDFNSYQSKNVAYMYQDGDDAYQVTAIVDSVAQPTFPAEFGGRRTRLARGSKGRYWAFKVEGIQKLQGLEYLPDGLTRRVK